MFKHSVCIALLFVLAFGSETAGKFNPKLEEISFYTMYDQALKKLGELREIVNSAISSAHTHLETTRSTFLKYSDEILASTQVKIHDESNKIDGQITVIKNLAESAGVSIQSCLRLTEPQLQRVLSDAEDNLKNCITDINKEVDKNVNAAVRAVDGTSAKVDDLEAQIKACTSGSILCLSPVVRQIDVDKIELPELIESEVHEASVLVETITPEVDLCSESNVSTYVTEATKIVEDIEACANSLM